MTCTTVYLVGHGKAKVWLRFSSIRNAEIIYSIEKAKIRYNWDLNLFITLKWGMADVSKKKKLK